jgi:hypothetical protein
MRILFLEKWRSFIIGNNYVNFNLKRLNRTELFLMCELKRKRQ